jgi:hypothetical protein
MSELPGRARPTRLEVDIFRRDVPYWHDVYVYTEETPGDLSTSIPDGGPDFFVYRGRTAIAGWPRARVKAFRWVESGDKKDGRSGIGIQIALERNEAAWRRETEAALEEYSRGLGFIKALLKARIDRITQDKACYSESPHIRSGITPSTQPAPNQRHSPYRYGYGAAGGTT